MNSAASSDYHLISLLCFTLFVIIYSVFLLSVPLILILVQMSEEMNEWRVF